MRVGATHVAVQRHFELDRSSFRDGERHAENRVRSEAGLVVGAVEITENAVDGALLERIESFDRVRDLAVDVPDRGEHTLARVSVTAVAQLDRFELSGGRAARDYGAPSRA